METLEKEIDRMLNFIIIMLLIVLLSWAAVGAVKTYEQGKELKQLKHQCDSLQKQIDFMVE